MNALTRRLRTSDDGMTLVELLVAMGIFSLLLALFGAGVVSMTGATARSQAQTDVVDEGGRAFSLLDKEVRSASAVNRAVRVGSTWYVEFQTEATGAAAGVRNAPQCTQWRLRGDTDTLQVRTWAAGGSATGWRTVASYVTNDPATEPPFVFHPADTSYQRQRLDLALELQRGRAPVAEVESTLVARNSSVNTLTNFDSDGDGLTERVCTEQGQP